MIIPTAEALLLIFIGFPVLLVLAMFLGNGLSDAAKNLTGGPERRKTVLVLLWAVVVFLGFIISRSLELGSPGQRGFSHPGKREIDEREIAFLANFYGKDSKTRGNGMESARKAGYPEWTAKTHWPRILKKYEDCSFKASARAVGITKPYLAFRLRQILEKGSDKEVLSAIRLMLANLGEATGEGGNVSINANGQPVMVILGATAERMKALKGGVAGLTVQRGRPPVMRKPGMAATPDELEEAKQAHEKYLSTLTLLPSGQEVVNEEAPVSNLDVSDDPAPGETED